MSKFSLAVLLCLSKFILSICAYQKTDPSEVTSLKIFHDTLVGDGEAMWNFNVDPCIHAMGGDPTDGWYDPAALKYDVEEASGINCDCTVENNTICHVIRIDVVGKNVSGQISKEIGSFAYLQNLRLDKTRITGPVPKEIGMLSRLQYLSFTKNRLSGSLPPEIGNMSKLLTLGLGTNQLSGALPKELGNVTTLQELWIADNKFEGEIPLELNHLKGLTKFYAHGNNFNGSIPNIFTSMSSLKELKLFGNRFQGSLPSSIWNLTALQKMYLDGCAFSNLSMPANMSHLKALNELSFRNGGLNGTIPHQIGDLKNLTYLDLSFNNFHGEIPSTLASMEVLNILFLGNNRLTGEIPGQFSNLTKLKILDLSYNQLNGSLPTWLNRNGLDTNLIWNFFDPKEPIRLDSASFNCLDSMNPCTRSRSGKSVGFSINCGGPPLTTSSMHYDDDSSTLGFSKATNGKWALSSIGNVTDRRFDQIVKTTIQVTTSHENPSIYQTARSSPSSLRYFGLNMENGNYSIELHFAEISISTNQTMWESIGKRIFDIYVQGKKIFEDYDISSKANGSFKAVVEKLTVQVTNGALEIHLKWSEKGTCCIPISKTFGPLISAIVVTPDFGLSTKSYGKKIGISIAAAVVMLILICLIIYLHRKRKMISIPHDQVKEKDFDYLVNKTNIKIYTHKELEAATEGFHAKNKLGEGGFGVVYKGTLKDDTIVAIKLLSSKSTQQGFINEVSMVSSIKHRNLVKLLGCCFEGDYRILVLEYLKNGNLQDALLGPPESRLNMDWSTRMSICLEIAKGIAYLHEESSPRIIHRDIKASNILLDKGLNPKIADFGLAKLFPEEDSYISTQIAGTIGYLSPEYAMRGQITEKVDVYSFGILLLEIISGRKNVDNALPLEAERTYLLEWARISYTKNLLLQLVDKDLHNYSQEEVVRIMELALFCTQPLPHKRPSMSEVVTLLEHNKCNIDLNLSSKDFSPGLSNSKKRDWNSLSFHSFTTF